MKMTVLSLLTLSFISLNAFAQSEDTTLSTTMTTTVADTTKGGSRELSIFQFNPVVTYATTGYSGIQGLNGGTFKNLDFVGGGLSAVVGKGAWQFETGLLYTTIGTEFSYSSATTWIQSFRIKSQSSYLDVPALARWTFMGNRRYRLMTRAGLVGGFLVDSSIERSTNLGGQPTSSNSRNNSAFHDTDLRYLLGLGFAYRLTPALSVLTSVEFQEGLSKLTTSELYDGIDTRSRSLGLTLGLGYRI